MEIPGKNETMRKTKAFFLPKSLGILGGTLHVYEVFFSLSNGEVLEMVGRYKIFSPFLRRN